MGKLVVVYGILGNITAINQIAKNENIGPNDGLISLGASVGLIPCRLSSISSIFGSATLLLGSIENMILDDEYENVTSVFRSVTMRNVGNNLAENEKFILRNQKTSYSVRGVRFQSDLQEEIEEFNNRYLFSVPSDSLSYEPQIRLKKSEKWIPFKTNDQLVDNPDGSWEFFPGHVTNTTKLGTSHYITISENGNIYPRSVKYDVEVVINELRKVDGISQSHVEMLIKSGKSQRSR